MEHLHHCRRLGLERERGREGERERGREGREGRKEGGNKYVTDSSLPARLQLTSQGDLSSARERELAMRRTE